MNISRVKFIASGDSDRRVTLREYCGLSIVRDRGTTERKGDRAITAQDIFRAIGKAKSGKGVR